MIRYNKTEKFVRLGAYGMGPYAMKKIKICPKCGQITKRTSLVAPAVEQMPQLYSPLASSIASQWYSAIAE